MAPESKLIGSINRYSADPSGWIGSAIMFIFALVAGYRWHSSGLIFFGLLIVRDLAASWFLISRKPNKEKTDSRLYEVLAYASSAWPFIYLNQHNSFPQAVFVSSILAILGFTISTLALFDLGSSFAFLRPIEALFELVFIVMSVIRCIQATLFLSLVSFC